MLQHRRQLEATGRVPPGSVARFSLLLELRDAAVLHSDRPDPHDVYRILTDHLGDLHELARRLVTVPS